MTSIFKFHVCLTILFIVNHAPLQSTPSTVFWTPCTTDIYETGIGHIDVDNFFTVFDKRGHDSYFPPDVGLEVGAFTWSNWSVETGVDYLGGTNDPFYFNIGLGIPEDKLFCYAPAFKIGFFNAGTQYQGSHRTNQNIVDLIVGHSLPGCLGGGTVCVGAFAGNRSMGKNRQGFMVSYKQPFCPATYCDNKDYFKWVLCADYASGKNTIGGGGVGIYYYFTPDISILTGPVWFNSAKINGNWKWSVQIDISFSMFDPYIYRY